MFHFIGFSVGSLKADFYLTTQRLHSDVIVEPLVSVVFCSQRLIQAGTCSFSRADSHPPLQPSHPPHTPTLSAGPINTELVSISLNMFLNGT